VRKKTMPSPKKGKAGNKILRTPVKDIAPEEQIVGAPLVGKVKSYDARRREMTLALEEPLSAGDALRVKGKDTDLSQRVERLCVGKVCVQSALAGELVTVSVADRVRAGDAVYKVRSS
jgi:hypothetical protein